MVALTGLVAVGYANVVTSYFLADDFLLIHTVLDGQGRPDWTVAVEHLYRTQYLETLRPLVTFLHTIAYTLWGANPTGYHVLNLGFHLANGFLLYGLVHQLGRHPSRLFAFFTTAVFLIHPIHPEAVTYIGALPGITCTTFYLLGLRFALRFAATSSVLSLALGCGSFVLALAAKEEAVSFPFLVGLLSLAIPARPPISNRRRRAIRVTVPFVALLALYLAYRWLIFGHIAPAYYRGVSGTPMDLVLGLGNFVMRLIAPINLDYTGHIGTLVFRSLLAVWLIGMLALAWVRRPRVATLAFCVATFLILLTPANKVVVLRIPDDLTNSRFLYLASIAFAVFVASVACGETRAGEGLPICVLVCYATFSLPLLLVNNMAWADASALMRQMQSESRRLTGNMVNVEVVNIPDRLHGVFFDRGGFRRSLLVPFVADNAIYRREQIVRLPIPLREDPILELAFPEPAVLSAAPEVSHRTPTEVVIKVTFQPRGAKLYEGEIRVRLRSCEQSTARISVRGRGTLAPPFPTYIVAAISPGEAFRTRDDALTMVASIADLKDGIAAEAVSIALLPHEPWNLTYYGLDELGRRKPANTPVRIDDGGHTTILMELTPVAGASPGRRVAPRISAFNAPIVPAIPHQTIVDTAGAFPVHPPSSEQARSDGPRHAIPQSGDDTCPPLHGLSAEIDLGVVPTSPYPLRQDRPFTYFAQSPALLFWDDTRNKLLRLADLDGLPPLFEAHGGDLSDWQRSPGLGYTRLATTVGALRVEKAGDFVATDVDLSTSEAAFCLVTMRVMGAASSYARLSWMQAPDARASIASHAFVILPDGYWHTYAVPLHSLASWRVHQRVRYLRLEPVLSEGWAELRSIRIIAAPNAPSAPAQ